MSLTPGPAVKIAAPAPWGTLLDLQSGKLITLTKSEYTVGRSSNCDIVVVSETNLMSRVHFKLAKAGRVVTLTDVSSVGTIINSVKVTGAMFQLPGNMMAEIEIPDADESSDSETKFFSFTPSQGGSRTDSEISSISNSAFYITRKELGKGSFSSVRLGINASTGERVAVKVIDKRLTNLSPDSMTDVAIAQEIAILKNCNHPNIVKFYDVESNKKFICIYLQRVRGGSMLERLEEKAYTGAEASFLFYQLLQGVRYLHAKNVCHRDIKVENVLIEMYGPVTRVLLTDFGMARAVGGGKAMTTRCGTLAYCSPELLKEGTYDKETDIWSAGVLLYVMLTATLPFYSNDDSVVSKRIRAADYDKKVLDREDIGGNAKDMVASLLTIDRKKRPSAEQALEHPWFANKKAILLKLYDKMLRKSGWQAPAAPVTTSARPPTAAQTAAIQSRGATTVRHSQNREPLAPATPTPAPRPKETPKTVGMLGQASETDFVAGTPCPPETAKRPREQQATYGTRNTKQRKNDLRSLRR